MKPTTTNQWGKATLAFAMACGLAAMSQAVVAQSRDGEPVVRQFTAPTGSLGRALLAVANTYSVNIIAPNDLVAGKAAPAVSGSMTAVDAIARLLAGSGLVAKRSHDGALVVSRQSAVPPASDGSSPSSVTKEIEELVVTGHRQYLYREDSTNVLGIDTPLKELPATVNVITRDFLEDAAAYDIEDVITYVPGVITGGFQGRAGVTFIVRGFDNDATYFNGLRQFQEVRQTPSLDNVERIEIVKGPAGADLAFADAGGALNFVTKKPLPEFGGDVFAGVGDFGYRRIGADVTGPITADGSLRYRVIGAYSERAEWRDGRPDETPRWTAAPSLAWDYAPGGSLLFEYQHTFSNEPLDRGIFYLEGAGFEDNFGPREFSVHQTTLNEQEATTNRYEVSVDQALGEIFSLELRGQWFDEEIDNFAVQAASFAALYEADRVTWNGVETSGSLSLRDLFFGNDIENYSAVLTAAFALGAIENSVRVGYQYSENSYFVDFGLDGIPGVRRIANDFDIFDRDNSQIIEFTDRGTQDTFFRDQEVDSLFVQWSGKVADRARLIAAARYDDVTSTDVFNAAGSPGTPTSNVSDEVSFRFAGSYDLTDTLSAFAGYSDSYTPQGGVTVSLEPIEPLHNVSYEAGLKWELFGGGVLWSNTVYEITRDNIAAGDPDDPTDIFVIPFGEVRIRGFESEFIGTVTDNFDISAAATFQDSENTRTEDPSLKGNEFFGVPEYQFSAFAHYLFEGLGVPGLSARLGLIRVGEREGNAQAAFQLPAYTRVDLGVKYDFNDRVSFDLFVENLLDETYFEQTQGRSRPDTGIIPGDRRLLQFNVRYRL